jgi:hypothetical protein
MFTPVEMAMCTDAIRMVIGVNGITEIGTLLKGLSITAPPETAC